MSKHCVLFLLLILTIKIAKSVTVVRFQLRFLSITFSLVNSEFSLDT